MIYQLSLQVKDQKSGSIYRDAATREILSKIFTGAKRLCYSKFDAH